MELPKRKHQRLKNFDYSQNNAYFITVCTKDNLNLFGGITNGSVILNDAGKMVEEKLLNISDNNGISIDNHIVMPNHIHAIILICHDGTAHGPFPTLPELVRRFKTITTNLYIDGVKNSKFPPFDRKIWQKSSYHSR